MARWWAGVAGWSRSGLGFYTIPIDAGVAYPDSAGEVNLLLDQSGEDGATADIFAADLGDGYRRIRLKAGLTIVDGFGLFEWTPNTAPPLADFDFGAGFLIVDDASNVLLDERYYNTFPGAGGASAGFGVDVPYTMPVDGYLLFTFDNDMGGTVTTLGPNPAYVVSIDWSL